MSPDEREKRDKADMIFLLGRPEFVRFLWRAIQSAGILSRTTDGSDSRDLSYDAGRRNLGLDILSMVEAGQPAAHPDGQPILTLIQTFREEANQPQEKINVRRKDRYDDLSDGDD